ncbi:L-fucose/L-arabinose isomerase family protein [Maledivibacter halophilus]|uniref:L-fucose isomerase n=1 Tax=Maledivibacter halophilus TaxID=36842 RepID=A0A1T5MN82_9FIRM|nr:L-fucose/L-arabinose isomerase family protein [Maledivibacter halophilus]SKC89687.1 L-fucose isomerase [Maledivibacter halophilus]
MKIGLLSFGFPNFRYDIAQDYLNSSIKKLRSKKYNLVYKDTVLIEEGAIENGLNEIRKENVDLLIIQCGTYSLGSAMTKVIELFRETPLLLWGFREPYLKDYRGLPLNSLCGLNMYGSFLKKAEKKYSYVYGDIDEDRVYEKIDRVIKAIEVKTKLNKSKFCIIGGRVPGFYLSNVDELQFRFKIGPEIKYYSIASLLKDADEINDKRVEEEVKKIKSEAEIKTTNEMLEKSARIYLAIKDFKEANKIDAFTIKCWPEFQSLYNCSVCGVVSRLNNKGIMTSCEGDVTGLATMYIQYLITNKPSFFVDLVNVNDKGIAKVWHCGPAPISLAKDSCRAKYIEHPTIKNGIGFATEFKMKQGRLVMLKLKEDKDGYALFMAKGTGIEEDRELVANQADIKFDIPAEKVIDTIMDNGIEHHYAIAYDDIEKELMEVCKWMDIEVLKN